jgi:GNAT superfamily N-acetyltransferase
VGGEFKEEKDGKRVYELRRMSVDSQIRGRGIGKRLVRRLEKELDRLSTIFLTCSNLQAPAHVLYKGQNFQLQNKSVPPEYPKGFEIFRFEKHY